MKVKFFVHISLFVLFVSAGRAGNTWTNHGPLYKVIKAVSVSQQDSSVLYAGAFGWGVFKSTDAGNTWTNSKVGLSNAYVRSVSALSDSVVFCGTNDGVFKTTDGGETWSIVLSTPFSVRNLAYDTQTNNIYAATFGSGMFKSTNQGSSWTAVAVTDPVVSQTISHLWSIGIFGRDSLYVGGSLGDVTSGGALFRSLNGGTSWVQVQRGLHIGSSVHSIAISPSNPDVSLIIGTATKGVYKSTNGGLNWTDINGTGTANPLVDKQINAAAFSANYRYIGTDSVGGFFLRSLGDTSLGWIQGTGLPGAQAVVSSIAINRANQSTTFAGTEGQGVFRSVNQGFNWSARNGGMLGIAARVIERNGNGQMILGTDFGDGIWFSPDQGTTWNRSTGLPTSSAITSIGITNNPSIIYAGAYGTGVFKSTDGGTTWAVTDSTTINQLVRTLSVHPTNANLVYTGTQNGVYQTINGGATWQGVNNGIPAGASIRSIVMDRSDPNILYAGTDSLFMFKTTNGGTTWTNITSANGFLPQDKFIRTITIDYNADNVLYAGSDSGRIYKSSNSGSTWTLHAKLPSTHSVRSILIHPGDHRIFFAATFGEGVFMSPDSGSHWLSLNDGLTDQEIYVLESDQGNPLTIYAGSVSHGVYRTSFTFGNHTPVLSPIGHRSVLSGHQLQFQVSAEDSDLTIPSLTATGLPVGASFIDSTNGHGMFTWTPTAGQIGSYSPTFYASDGISSDSERVTIDVLDSNSSTVGSIPVQAGWNLLSVPVTEGNYLKSTVYPQASSPAYGYAGSYVAKDTLQPGAGYWMKFASAQDISFGGGTITKDTIIVTAGWNMIGSVSEAFPAGSISPIPPVAVTSNLFGYTGMSGYVIADSINPGKGYWMKVNNAGKVALNSTSSQTPLHQGRAYQAMCQAPDNRVGVLWFQNKEGARKELYLLSEKASPTTEQFELPPGPPAEGFDVRFSATQSSAARVSSDSVCSLPIQMSSSGFEVNVSCAMDLPDRTVVVTVTSEAGRFVIPLSTQGVTVIPLHDGVCHATLQIVFDRSTGTGDQKKMTLHQNYPNPFNPSTSISYDLPYPAFVKLTLFDILGSKVQELVKSEQPPGTHTVSWTASNMGSGVYFYRIDVTSSTDPSRSYHETKRMFLVR